MKKAVERIGEKHGRLIILSIIGVNKHQRTIANCLCECGVEKAIAIDHLIRKEKSTKSCGCLQKENASIIFSYNINPWKSEFSRWQKSDNRNIPSELTFEQWQQLVQSNCFYCNQQPNQPCHNGQKVMKNGIDRMNPELGYTIENSKSCCSQCNYAKWKVGFEDFLSWIQKVNAHLFPTAQDDTARAPDSSADSCPK